MISYTRPASKYGLSIGQVAKMLGVNVDSIRRAERQGRLKQARREPVSQERFYLPADLEELRSYFAR